MEVRDERTNKKVTFKDVPVNAMFEVADDSCFNGCLFWKIEPIKLGRGGTTINCILVSNGASYPLDEDSLVRIVNAVITIK